MPVSKNKKSITITLDKELVEGMDNVIRVINEENAKRPIAKREEPINRSKFIQGLIINLFANANKKDA